MPGITETAKPTNPAKAARVTAVSFVRPVLMFAIFVTFGVTGCNTGNKLKPDDPLLGDFVPKSNGPAANSPSKTRASLPLPAYPEATKTASTAALAAGDPLSGSRPLQIADGQNAGGWYGMSGKTAAPNATLTSTPGHSPTVVPLLRRPEPTIGEPPSAPGITVPSHIGAIPSRESSPRAADYRQLQAELTARRVAWQRGETFEDGYKFICAVPNPINANFQRVYEATARDAESAMQAVLVQIDRQR